MSTSVLTTESTAVTDKPRLFGTAVVADYSNALLPFTANRQSALTRIDFKTRTASPPLFVPVALPKRNPALLIADTSLDVVVQLDKPGTFYVVVVDKTNDTASPLTTSAAVKAYANTTLTCSGAVVAALTDTSCTVVGLTAGGAYHVYVVAEDLVDPAPGTITSGLAFPAANLQNDTYMAAVKLTSVVMKDITGPVITAFDTTGLASSLSNLTGHTVTVNVKSDSNGTAYYAIMRRTSTAVPTAFEVKLGSSSAGRVVDAFDKITDVAAPTVASGTTTSTLLPFTTYTLYVTAEDSPTAGNDGYGTLATYPNLQQTLVAYDFTTPDVTPPVFVGTTTIRGKVEYVTGTSMRITGQLNKPGKVRLANRRLADDWLMADD